jgi:MFS family permease
MLTLEWNIEDKLAGALYSLPFFISAGVSPFLGILIDRIGKRAMMSK